MFVGVDGCRTGWAALALSDEGVLWVRHFADFSDVITAIPEAACVAVDMPVGLVDDVDRDADRAARDYLKGQASSVFGAPVRSVLAAPDNYEEASRLSRAASGKGLTRQAHALVRKIEQVDLYADDARVHEVHPEVTFRIMNGGSQLPRKKSWQGFWTRLQLLRDQGIELPKTFEGAETIPVDDIVDAAAAAWSARRVAKGQARRFPESSEQRDRSGRPIAIWA